MAKFQIEINVDNAAFEENENAEVVRILEEISFTLKRTYHLPITSDINLFDINGNKVGKAKRIDDLPDDEYGSEFSKDKKFWNNH